LIVRGRANLLADSAADLEQVRMLFDDLEQKEQLIGLLDNAKIGTERLYDHIEEILRSRYGVREFIRRRKPDTSRPVPDAMLAQMSGADAIVSGVGD
jgi:transcriptional regulator of heat shock response